MNVIVSVENNLGISFFGRRLSRDIRVYEDILKESKGTELYVSQKSEELFQSCPVTNCKINVVTAFDENTLSSVKQGESIFIEENLSEVYLDQVSKLTLYKWNRDYPYDQQLNIDLSAFNLISTNEFIGNSHEKITREIYVRAD